MTIVTDAISSTATNARSIKDLHKVSFVYPGTYQSTPENADAVALLRRWNLGKHPLELCRLATVYPRATAKQAVQPLETGVDLDLLPVQHLMRMFMEIMDHSEYEQNPIHLVPVLYRRSKEAVAHLLEQMQAYVARRDYDHPLLRLKQGRMSVVRRQVELCVEYLDAHPDTSQEDVSQLAWESLDDYIVKMNEVLRNSVEYELDDARMRLQRELEMRNLNLRAPSRFLKAACSESGVRFGISSANASDNYSFSCLEPEGGHVLNASIHLCTEASGNDFQPVVSVHVDAVPSTDGKFGIQLESLDNLEPKGLKTLSINIHEETVATTFGQYRTDPRDHFRLMKHALVFCGVLGKGGVMLDDKEPMAADSFNLYQDLQAFLGSTPFILRIRLVNRGPSRSGFASSSAVSANLLRALYRAMGNQACAEDNGLLATLTWLFENSLGLRSGRQDIDGALLGGMNVIHYQPHLHFTNPDVCPVSSMIPADRRGAFFEQVYQRILLVDSGIARNATLDIRRGLNFRHLMYLTKHPRGFVPIKESIHVHHKIVEAFVQRKWEELGKLFTHYMQLREQIDPTALQSKFDQEWGRPLLPLLFRTLLEKKLVYGGMLSGAMGGGVMILVLADGATREAVMKALCGLRQSVPSAKDASALDHLHMFRYRIAME